MKSDIAPILQTVRLSDVKADQRLRPVSAAGVQAILASVAEIGRIKDPVHVRKDKKGLTLLAGGHRLAAYAELGILEAEVWIWSGITNDHARLIEIDDNLAGAEMCPLDTAVFLAERKRVYERLHPETTRGGDRKSIEFKNQTDIESVRSFVTTTSEKFGLSERHVRRLVEAGEKLGVDSARLRNIPRPITLKDLIEIAKIGEPTERYAIVDALREGTARSASEARRTWAAKEKGEAPAVKDPVEEAFIALSKVWARAPMAAKKRFLINHRSEIWEAENKGESLIKYLDKEGDKK
ncbi:MAG: chromosome partitioning protein ParB [Rhodobacterales bacterium]|nr:MAG: chromosome partitioning protein ParB [Rhodobacterales bacterium]